MRQQYVIAIEFDALDFDQHDFHDHRRTDEYDRTSSIDVDGGMADSREHHPLPNA